MASSMTMTTNGSNSLVVEHAHDEESVSTSEWEVGRDSSCLSVLFSFEFVGEVHACGMVSGCRGALQPASRAILWLFEMRMAYTRYSLQQQ